MELMVPLDVKSGRPLYEQIYEHIKREIKDRGLPAASRLPSTRALAENLKVSRSTTQMAYDQLLSEGYIESYPCKGYFVAQVDGLLDMERAGTVGSPLPDFSSGQSDEKLYGVSIDFSPTGIDMERFPFNTWRRITKETLVDDNKEMFVNGDPQGEPALREALKSYLHSARGVNCRADQIVIGAGSEYLLILLEQILGPGLTIAMENPTYKQAYRVFTSLGCRVEPVEMDRYGIDVSQMRESGAGAAYIMPSHQYPTGVVMPVGRRQELLRWACEREGRYLIEDDYDSEFRYRGKPIPSLQGMDGNGRVIYIGTFSKSIAPAIRFSYMVLPDSLLSLYKKRAGFYNSTVSRIDQNILYRFLAEGHYERHLNRMRSVYKGKHDLFLQELKALEPGFEVRGEYAGLHLLLVDKAGRTEEELVKTAREGGIAVYGISPFYIEPHKKEAISTIILGYAGLSEGEIREGVSKLCSLWAGF